MNFKLQRTIKPYIYGIILVAFLTTSVIAFAASRLTFNGGIYTNLNGSGEEANDHDGDYCDPDKGECDGDSKAYVVAFICDGSKRNCNNHDTESEWTTGSMSVLGEYKTYKRSYADSKKLKLKCDQTIQIDVFDKKCRVGDDGWECKDENLKDYMVFYNECKEDKKVPVCKFDYNPKSGSLPLTINFDGSLSSDADGTIAKYEWTFSDGTKKEGQKVSHTFTDAKTELVSLVVTDNDNQKSTNECKASFKVNVHNDKPVCKIVKADPTKGDKPLKVKFDASDSFDKDGTISKYLWDFGDGKTGEGKLVEHEYKDDGNFKAKLIVEDDLSSKSDKCEVEINVKDVDDDDEDDNDDDDTDNDDNDNKERKGTVLSIADSYKPKGQILSGVQTIKSPKTGDDNLFLALYLLLTGILIKILLDTMKKEGYMPKFSIFLPNFKFVKRYKAYRLPKLYIEIDSISLNVKRYLIAIKSKVNIKISYLKTLYNVVYNKLNG